MPLPVQSTARLLISYVIVNTRHVAQLRFPSGTVSADAVATARAIITAARPLLTTASSFDSARWYNDESVISFPVQWGTAIVGTNTATHDDDEVPQFMALTGRDALGVRVRFTLFGYTASLPAAYRVGIAQNTNVAALVTAMTANVPAPCTVANNTPVWNPYINVGRNAYWQRKARRIA